MKLVDKNGHLYVPPKRGQLPRRYRLEEKPRRDRQLALVLLGCALLWAGVWWALR